MNTNNVTNIGHRASKLANTETVNEDRFEPRDGELWRIRVVDGVPKSRRRVCNFIPEVVERVETRDAAGDMTVGYIIDLHTRTGIERVEVTDAKLLAFLTSIPGLVSDEGRDRPYLRRAIAESAVDKPTTRRYAHTGWTTDDEGRSVFLHAAGAIGADGRVDGMRTDFGDRLANYALPDPPRRQEAGTVIRNAIDTFLAAGDRNVMLILLAAIARAPLGTAPTYMVFLSGPTGSGKTSLARQAAAWFGPTLAHKDAKTWSFMGTPYALQRALSDTCCVAVLVDEYLGTPGHQRTVELLGRAVTGAVRDRLTANLSERPAYAPNAMVIATGETDVDRASLAARIVTVECTPSMRPPVAQFRRAEQAALDGLFAHATSAYIRDLARERDRHGLDPNDMPYGWTDEVNACRAEIDAVMPGEDAHPRAVDNVVDLFAAFAHFMGHAVKIGAYSPAEARQFRRVTLRALLVPLDASVSDEAAQIVEMLRDGLRSGRCHLTTRAGGPPTASAQLYGWALSTAGPYGDMRPQGRCIGYWDGDTVHLIPGAFIEDLCRARRQLGGEATFTQRQVGRFLHERGLLPKNTKRGYGTRITIDGKQHDVWPIPLEILFPTDQDDPDHARTIHLLHDQLGAVERQR